MIIDRMVSGIPNAQSGFDLVFSSTPFPGYHAELERIHEEYGGYWYRLVGLDMEGWLCPAFFKYFDEAPLRIYAQFKPRAS